MLVLAVRAVLFKADRAKEARHQGEQWPFLDFLIQPLFFSLIILTFEKIEATCRISVKAAFERVKIKELA
jgi:hypothetical protein